MPDRVTRIGTQELLPGKHWVVFQNERTGQITKVPKEIMDSPAGTSMLSYMQGYGYGGSPRDPGQEGAHTAAREDQLRQWSGPADAAEIAARVPAEVGTIPKLSLEREHQGLLDGARQARGTDANLLARRDSLLNRDMRDYRQPATDAGPVAEQSPMGPNEIIQMLRSKLQGR